MNAGLHGAFFVAPILAAGCVGKSEDHPPSPVAADGGVVEDAAASAVDGSVVDAAVEKSHQKRHSLAVSGRGRHSLHDFTLKDKQGREVVRLNSISGTTDVDALRRGMFHVKSAKIDDGVQHRGSRKRGRMSYQHHAVHIDGGPGCEDLETPPAAKGR